MSWAGRNVVHRCQVPFSAVSPPAFPLAGTAGGGPGGPGGVRGDGEERVREHGQGDVPVPGAVAADLVVVQAGLVLGLGEAVLDSPARARYRGELGEGDRPRRVAAVEGQLKVAFLAGLQGPAGQQDPGAVGGDQRPVVKPRALSTRRRSSAAATRPPGPGPRARRPASRPPSSRSASARRPPARSGIFSRFQPFPQSGVAAVGLVAGHPRERDPGLHRAPDHASASCGFVANGDARRRSRPPRHRSRSSAHFAGRYSSRSISARAPSGAQ